MTIDPSMPEPQDRLPGEAPHGPSARFQMPVIGGDLDRSSDQVAPHPGAAPLAPQPTPLQATPVPIGGTAREQTVVSVFGSVTRDGHWTVARRMTAVTVFGDATLDLRQASFEEAEVHITAYVAFGDLKVVVPPGVAVDSLGVMVFGDRKTQLRTAAAPGAPRVVITAYGAFGEVKVRELEPGEHWSAWRNKLKGR